MSQWQAVSQVERCAYFHSVMWCKKKSKSFENPCSNHMIQVYKLLVRPDFTSVATPRFSQLQLIPEVDCRRGLKYNHCTTRLRTTGLVYCVFTKYNFTSIMHSSDTVPSGDPPSRPLFDRNTPLSWTSTLVFSVYSCFALGSWVMPQSHALTKGGEKNIPLTWLI